MKKFGGTGIAMVTPFNEDKSVDFGSLKKLISYITEGGVEFLVVLGTTGEAATLSAEERHKVVRFVVEQNGGKLPVVVGIGGNNTMQLGHQDPEALTITTLFLNLLSLSLTVSPLRSTQTNENLLVAPFLRWMSDSTGGRSALLFRTAVHTDFHRALPRNLPFTILSAEGTSAVIMRVWAPSTADSISLFPATLP